MRFPLSGVATRTSSTRVGLLVGVVIVAASVAVSACEGNEAAALGERCFVTTDCAPGLVCIPSGDDGSSTTCSNNVGAIQNEPPRPGGGQTSGGTPAGDGGGSTSSGEPAGDGGSTSSSASSSSGGSTSSSGGSSSASSSASSSSSSGEPDAGDDAGT